MEIEETKKEVLKALGSKEVELGRCPYCLSENYSRDGLELVEDNVRTYCSCENCEKEFIEWFGLDEIYSKLQDEEFSYTTTLNRDEKEIILKAMNLLIEQENDTNDYSKIIKKLNDKAVKEE